MAKDINLTSREWNDMVFANRPKDYGAYEMRESSSKRHTWAIIITFVLVVIVAFLPQIMEQVAKLRPAPKNIDTTVELAQLDDELEKQNDIQKETLPPPPPIKTTIAFVAPEIVDEVKPEEQVKSQEDLQDSKADISLFTVEGTENGTVDLADVKAANLAAEEKVDNKVYVAVQQMPTFPGGETAMFKYLNDNIHYPDLAKDNGISGVVSCQFTVNTDGSIVDIKVLKSPHQVLSDEAVRLIKSMPHWLPGKQNGKAVRVSYTLPVTFKLIQ